MQGVTSPKIKKMVEKLKDLANTCYVYESGDGVFQVGDRGTDYIVDIHTKSCSSYCGDPDHNRKGCKYLKAGLPPPNRQVEAEAAQENVQHANTNVQEEGPVRTQV